MSPGHPSINTSYYHDYMSETRPIVPEELEPLLDEQVLEVHERWRSYGLSDIHRMMPEPVETEYGKAVILDPPDRDENSTIVLGLSPQHGWKPSVAIRALFMQQAVAPRSRVVALPENSVGDMYYSLNPLQLEYVTKGTLYPYFEHRVRLLEALEVEGAVDFTGYSFGAVAAMGMAYVNSNKWTTRVINADEAPNAPNRNAAKLNDDMVASGTFQERQQAAADGKMRVLDAALNAADLAALRRSRSSGVVRENMALLSGMAAQRFEDLVRLAAANHLGATIKLGRVAGSHLVTAEQFSRTEQLLREGHHGGVHFATYSGPGAPRHATAINAVAHALMYQDAVRRRPTGQA